MTTWLLVVGVVGCGSSGGLEKVVVSGKVTYKGQPVENGDIFFYPMEGTRGPMSGASIKDGHYIAKAKGGVPVGEHLVRISAYRLNTGKANDDMMASAKSGGQRIQYLPEKYNEKSELRLKVDGNDAETTQDYELVE